MAFSKFKAQKFPPKHPKPKNQNIKMSCKEASNKKSSENKLWLELKILRTTFLNISKLKNYPKIPKNPKFEKIEKACKECLKSINFRKQIIVKI